jgi:iron complex transport system permease protein
VTAPTLSPALDAVAAYRAGTTRRIAALGLGLAALAVSFLFDVATGPALLPVGAVARSVLGLGTDRAVEVIVWTIRLPVALIALAVGAALGLSGVVMQTILNNPLASSYTLGISGGAGFGAALVIVLGAGLPVPEVYAVPASAFLFAGIACAFVFALGSRRGATPEILVLAGIACLFLFQALLSLLQVLASPEALQQIVFWLFGSLQRATWSKLALVAGVATLCLVVLLVDAWRLTALRLGDERARSLGVDVRGLRLRAFVIVSLLTGVAVAFCGTIGFVGLVAPHIARILVGEDQRFLLPASAVTGALLLSAASTVSKLVVPGALFPIGIVTALLGVPFFLWLVLTSKRSYW